MDFSTASASSSPDSNIEADGLASRIVQWQIAIPRKFQQLLDRLTPHSTGRWIGSLVVAAIYSWRVYYLKGFYIITYALGIYILNLLIGFLSPQVDPDNEGPGLPIKDTDEFRPFIRRLPEFKFWYALTKGFCLAFVLTFFEVFDVPVFWPILLVYWMVLFFLTMKRQIRHMIKHRYVPFSFGKQRYNRKKAPSEKVLTELVDEKEEEIPLMDTKSSSGSELA